MIPANSTAETIRNLRNENVSLSQQIQKNADLIEQLEPLAEWSEEPQPNTGVVEPENQ
jgi:hypothetical protein